MDKSKGMRILMVVGHYPPFIGGAGVQCERLASSLVTHVNASVEVLTVGHSPNDTYTYDERVPIHWVPKLGIPWRGKYRGATMVYMVYFFLYILLNARRFDVIHVHQGMEPALAVTLAVKCLIRRHIVIVKIGNAGKRFDLDVLRRKVGIMGGWIVRMMIKNVYFHVINQVIFRQVRALGVDENRVYCVPNALPAYVVSQDVLETQDKKVIVYCGRFDRHKNVTFVIRVFEELYRTRQDVELALIGEGEELSAVETYSREHRLSHVVKVYGCVSPVFSVLERCDIMLLPSAEEGVSNALLEALQCGLHAVVSDIPQHQELAAFSSSIDCCPLEDISAWCRAVVRVCDTSQRRCDRIDRVSKELREYSAENVARTWQDIYNSLVKDCA